MSGNSLYKSKKLPSSLDRVGKYFSLAKYKESRVYISADKVVLYFDLLNIVWRKAPSLNEARYKHASISLREHIYVFCGFASSRS